MAYIHTGMLGSGISSDYSRVLNEAQMRTRFFSSRSIRSGAGTMVFVSHKHTDLYRQDIKNLLNKLETEYHASTYVDSEDWKMPNKTCAETAERIKEVINSSQRFILFATEESLRSMWCNWEVGVADKKHSAPETMAILPILRANQREDSFIGNEYLQLYPRIEKNDYHELVVIYPDNKRTCSLKRWLEGNLMYG